MTKNELRALAWYYGLNRKAGQPALAAWLGAKRTVHFRAQLSADVKANKKRSQAARRGWKSRRAAA